MVRPAAVPMTYGVENAVSEDGRNELLDVKREQDRTNNGEGEVVS